MFLEVLSLPTCRNLINNKHIKKPNIMQTGSIGTNIGNGFEKISLKEVAKRNV
jgi:hypothetical protein